MFMHNDDRVQYGPVRHSQFVHRIFLHSTHILRRIGAVRQCCPHNFYIDSADMDTKINAQCEKVIRGAQRLQPPPTQLEGRTCDQRIPRAEHTDFAAYWFHAEYPFHLLYKLAPITLFRTFDNKLKQIWTVPSTIGRTLHMQTLLKRHANMHM